LGEGGCGKGTRRGLEVTEEKRAEPALEARSAMHGKE